VKNDSLSRAMSNQVLIIIPTYNERGNLPSLCHRIFQQLPQATVLIVDDNSPDGTGALAEELRQADPRIQVLHRPGKQGLGTAYLAGFRHGLAQQFDYFFGMDADFSHDPKYLPQMLATAQQGADVVIGSRYIEGGGTQNWGLWRQCVSRGGSLYARSILGVPIRDLTGGFKCFKRRVLETLDLDALHSEGYSFQIEMTYRSLKQGFVVKELPIIFVDRRVGQSKMSKAIFCEAVWMVWALRLGWKLGG
jgi:dolichol-phosphate mannosyltransferase